ncbi:hypothetical protein JOF56_005095 [Kibdelosporangium banguiense]|uniref:Uncharacterized protein n=1 Tax=Kibdelosporangium banguiense TaxID=1365924 RepID=A0ABS4TL61_9PSEU|nr:hypothetical protein [Kibdelosporangium banguiense]MBP2324710.1 hypothetical protein [Kibdelosporangium banguiense]
MIVSLLYHLARRLLSVPTVLLRRDITKDAELLALRHETPSSAARSPAKSDTNQQTVSGSPPCPRYSPDTAGTRSSPSNPVGADNYIHGT